MCNLSLKLGADGVSVLATFEPGHYLAAQGSGQRPIVLGAAVRLAGGHTARRASVSCGSFFRMRGPSFKLTRYGSHRLAAPGHSALKVRTLVAGLLLVGQNAAESHTPENDSFCTRSERRRMP